jgi:hypothetical protein
MSNFHNAFMILMIAVMVVLLALAIWVNIPRK